MHVENGNTREPVVFGAREQASLFAALVLFGFACAFLGAALPLFLDIALPLYATLMAGGTLTVLVGLSRLRLAASGEQPFTARRF